MPADYDSTARALALPVSPPRSPTISHQPSRAAWSRRQSSQSHSGSRSPFKHGESSLRNKVLDSAERVQRHVYRTVKRLTPVQRILAGTAIVVALVIGILFLVFNERIFQWLEPLAVRAKNTKGGWLILWSITFATAFPPLIGYSTSVTIAGFVYGLTEGWLIAASATVVGSLCSFLVSRTILSRFVHRLVANDTRFAALSLVLKHDGLKLLIMIRLCPLPYSISNGAMSTVPTVKPLVYALATAIASPKLMVHVFIGSRLAAIAKSGEKMDAGTKAINYASIVGGMILGAATGYFIYQRTIARSEELEAEERASLRRSTSQSRRGGDFSDDPEERTAAAPILRDDDIDFLDDEETRHGYRDEFTDDEDDVFRHGDGDDEEAIGMETQNSKLEFTVKALRKVSALEESQMDHDDFDNVSWRNDPESDVSRPNTAGPSDGEEGTARPGASGTRRLSDVPQQAGHLADAVDLGGIGDGRLDCTVDTPLKENDGTKDAYVSYLVTTHTDFKSFQKPDFSVRRRFTDFVFLYKTLSKEYPATAVPPLPDKHKMEYVRGDRFGPDFTQRRAHSLHRFLKRLTLHPVLRRATLLIIFLESPEWNAHMRLRPSRGSSVSEQGTSVFDNFADTFVNAFSKVHKPDKRFIEVREKADKLDEDLGHVEKIVARLTRREGDLETDYSDLATQFQRLVNLEPGVQGPVHTFATSVDTTSRGLKELKDHTDQNYLGSLRDMQAYIVAIKSLLKTREQKQLDFEGLTEYLNKAVYDRDTLASSHGASGHGGPGGFIRSKIEDVRGVDHEQSRRERVRKLELQIERLTREVEEAKRTTEMFDEEVIREVADFERIKAVEFRDTLGGLADRHCAFYGGVVETWERYVRDMEREGIAPSA